VSCTWQHGLAVRHHSLFTNRRPVGAGSLSGHNSLKFTPTKVFTLTWRNVCACNNFNQMVLVHIRILPNAESLAVLAQTSQTQFFVVT
jgi:hypothetical protein